LSVSASQDRTGKIHVSMCNLDPNKSVEVLYDVRGVQIGKISGKILTHSDMTAHNSFESPERVKPGIFRNFQKKDNIIIIVVPSKSAVVLEINQR